MKIVVIDGVAAGTKAAAKLMRQDRSADVTIYTKGKKIARGIPLTKIFTSEEEIMDVVEKAILLFRDEGISGERFADTVNRLGFDYVNEKLINGSINKTAILNKTVKGGASC